MGAQYADEGLVWRCLTVRTEDEDTVEPRPAEVPVCLGLSIQTTDATNVEIVDIMPGIVPGSADAVVHLAEGLLT